MATKSRHKPKKPYPSFPLTPHLNGQWCKKIRGKVHFFGIWSNPTGAFAEYHATSADLHAGRQPQPQTVSGEGFTVKDAFNQFLNCSLIGKGRSSTMMESDFAGLKIVAPSYWNSQHPSGKGLLVNQVSPLDFQRHPNRLENALVCTLSEGTSPQSRPCSSMRMKWI